MEQNPDIRQNIQKWWASRRPRYNAGLIISGITAFIFYAIFGITLIAPHDPEFEVTLFTTVFQGIGYLIMMTIANLCYNLGPYIDIQYNKHNSDKFRKRLYNLGFWGSFSFPFLIPIMIVIQYFVNYA